MSSSGAMHAHRFAGELDEEHDLSFTVDVAMLIKLLALQAWGLMELQRGNVVAAVLLLERCVAYDPRCSPVLKWKAVRIAQQTVTSRRRRSLSELASGDLSTFA